MAHPEPPRTPLLLGTACLVIGAACGWWLRGESAPLVAAVEIVPQAMSAVTPAPNTVPHESNSAEGSADIPLNFATEIRAALEDRDPLSREIRIREMVRDLDPADLPAAAREIGRLGKERWAILEMLGARWGAINPLGGLEFAGGEDDDIRIPLIEGIATAWVALDPSAAVAWMNAMPDERNRADACLKMVGELGRTDPKAALQLMLGRPRWDDQITPLSISSINGPKPIRGRPVQPRF